MNQTLAEFDLQIEDMKSVKFNQPFVFGPSKKYISTSLVELPILISRMDSKEDVLVVQTYLVDAEVPFLCGKQTLEAWNFKIDGTNKILEIKTRADQDGATKLIKIIDTTGGHYGVILETKKKSSSNILFVEDEAGILFVEDKNNDICSFKSVRTVHEVNRHKRINQLMAAYCQAEWMSPEVANIINRVINDCKVSQKFQRSVARPRVLLPQATSFNEVVTLDLKEFSSKYILWMIDLF